MLDTESTPPAWQQCGGIRCDPLISESKSLRVETKSKALLEAHVEMNFENLKHEINDFFDYTDLLSTLKEYYNAYQHYFDTQHEGSDNERVRTLMDHLQGWKQEDRLMIVQSIAYVALGSFCSGDALKDESKLVQAMITNNDIIRKTGAIKHLFKHLFEYTRNLPANNHVTKLIDTCLTILYVSLATYDSENSLVIDSDVPALLIKLATKTMNMPFPKKKLLLLLHKTLTVHFGQNTNAFKADLRKLYGLAPANEYSIRSRPKDMYDFHEEIKAKYTAYVPPKLDTIEAVLDNDTIDTTTFPFQKLFLPNMPTPSTPKAPPTTVKSEPSTLEYKREVEKKQSSTPFAYETPDAIKEAGQLYASYMYMSISEFQIIQERTKTTTSIEHSILNKIEQFYCSVVSDLPNLVHALLQQLVTMAPQIPNLTDWSDNLNDHEHADAVRNREIIRSVISSILLLLLKWLKTSHVMKFEYFSQLLVDSGYLMLSTRSLMIEDLKAIYQTKSDIENCSFFAQLLHMDFTGDGAFLSSACSTSSSFSISYSWDPPTSPSAESVETVINERNRSWILETLNILRMITKGKSVRNKILAQYKTWIPLKRIAKTYKDSMEELYALKLLKSQVQFLGLTWRSDNMKTISSIARRCPIGLHDEWLIQSDDQTNNQPEATMRHLVTVHHKQYQIDTHVDDEQLALDINHLFRQPLERLQKVQLVEPVTEHDGWNTPTTVASSITQTTSRKRNVQNDHNEDIDTDDEEEVAEKEEEDPLGNIDWGTLTEDELEARMNLVEEQTVPRWMSSDINDSSDWKVLSVLEETHVDSDYEEEETAPVYEEDDWL